MNSTALETDPVGRSHVKKATDKNDSNIITTMEHSLERQQNAFLKDPFPSAEERQYRLKQLKKALMTHQNNLVKTLNEDFGGRSEMESKMLEFMTSLSYIDYCTKELPGWMKESKRRVSVTLQPAKAKVIYQPLGVVGIVVPWNYPLFLAIGPLVTALAAGNRAMIKMSEFTPKTAEIFAKIMTETFPENLVTVVNGETEVAVHFTSLPFDHILFTGSTHVGKHVMSAAAKNLTPVTLELGGKSPVIIDEDFPIQEAAKRICYGKSLNAGQTCVSPDYILIKKHCQNAFIEAYKKAFNTMYPTINNNSDYTSVINKRQYHRLVAHVEDARKRGAQIITPSDEVVNDGSHRLPPHLIVNPTDDMTVMHEEIFGPLLPIIAIDSIDEAISYINARPRPLALYYFGDNKRTQEKVITHTHSGGVGLNETMIHAAMDDIPFGGIGASGIGHYHGHEGFLTLSKAKSVVSKGRFNNMKFLFPPYSNSLKTKLINALARSGH